MADIQADTYRTRRDRLRAELTACQADAALITKLVNVRYLTGFSGSNGALLVRRGSAEGDVFCTDGRYTTQAAAEVPDLRTLVDRRCAHTLAEHAARGGQRVLATEDHEVTVELHRELATLVADTASGARLATLGHVVERLRQVKDEAELALLREACAISDHALADLLDSVVVGRTERHIAVELERRMREYGADGPAFETIVASGPNAARPHHRPTDRRVTDGDFLKIDFGARYRGYHADETRTFVVGRAPADWQIEIYDVVFAAQKAGREALRPGASCADVDRAARAVITAAGYGEHFGHGLGHGVGLEVHEAPLLDSRPGTASDARLGDRVPVTVEPGVYLPDRGGVRIEDTLIVHDAADGGPELLTMTTKELLVL